MSIQDSEQFIEEIRRYTEARKAARTVRNMLANLNAAVRVAASKGVRCQFLGQQMPGASNAVAFTHLNVKCSEGLENNEPADWVLDAFREVATALANETGEEA